MKTILFLLGIVFFIPHGITGYNYLNCISTLILLQIGHIIKKVKITNWMIIPSTIILLIMTIADINIELSENDIICSIAGFIMCYVIAYTIKNYFSSQFIEYIGRHTMEITIPSKTNLRHFFEDFFNVTTSFLISTLKTQDKIDLYLINDRFDIIFGNIALRLNDVVDNINRIMNVDVIPTEEKYLEYIKKYHGILKTNHSTAHTYLLDKFNFSEFYVPPFLEHVSKKQEISENMKWSGKDFLKFQSGELNRVYDNNKVYCEDWKYIFDNSGIVYVTGGPGYGKSLFLKKIINDFEKMNILNSSEYLVIYGDLKAFYANGNQPMSMVSFLQNSMEKETLMDRKFFSVEMIEYYLKMGRCILLFDALDEVEKDKRENLHKRIISYFKNQNPNNKICITSRNRGFIPEKDVEVFDILPLNRIQIETYVDNIIKLGKFDKKDRKFFLEQSSVLVDKGFLNSFLILSLLINIYKAERELPENKMELYQKCFDYIAYRREKDKTKEKFDWNLISCMMKDNTFMELAQMCFPNNSDIGKEEIVEMLCKIYRGKYVSFAQTENAANDFLAFCSDRTELFVPAPGEDRFKFFHRSFFEYFYAQFIFVRVSNVDEVYELFKHFDVDSEVFELTFAMMKQKDEMRYQKLVEYLFEQVEKEINTSKPKFVAFNMLTLGMQVIDDNVYANRYIEFIRMNSRYIVGKIKKISNQWIIYSVINNNKKFIEKINLTYKDYSKMAVIKLFLESFTQIDPILEMKNKHKRSELEKIEDEDFFSRRFYGRGIGDFYIKIYLDNVNYSNVMNNLNETDLLNLMLKCNMTKKSRDKYLKLFSNYMAQDESKRIRQQKLMLINPYVTYS